MSPLTHHCSSFSSSSYLPPLSFLILSNFSQLRHNRGCILLAWIKCRILYAKPKKGLNWQRRLKSLSLMFCWEREGREGDVLFDPLLLMRLCRWQCRLATSTPDSPLLCPSVICKRIRKDFNTYLWIACNAYLAREESFLVHVSRTIDFLLKLAMICDWWLVRCFWHFRCW